MANSLGAFHEEEFGFYGAMSVAPGGPQVQLPPSLLAAIQKVGIFLGGGVDDPIHNVVAQEVQGLQRIGLNVSTDFIAGGYEWFVWRILLRDFLTRVAFRS